MSTYEYYNCHYCKKDITRKSGEVKNPKTICCSHACANAYRTILHTETRECGFCKNTFQVPHSKLKATKKSGTFCSKECLARGTNVSCICVVCSITFIRHLSQFKIRGGDFCSKSCANATEPRFWRTVIKGKNDKDCWSWTAATNKVGHGVFFDGSFTFGHRYSYELHYGPIPEGLYICHKCDNPPCCNPLHLYAGTAQDNADDRTDKTRWAEFKM